MPSLELTIPVFAFNVALKVSGDTLHFVDATKSHEAAADDNSRQIRPFVLSDRLLSDFGCVSALEPRSMYSLSTILVAAE